MRFREDSKVKAEKEVETLRKQGISAASRTIWARV